MGSAAPAAMPQTTPQPPRPAIAQAEPVLAEGKAEVVPGAAPAQPQLSPEDLGAAISSAVEAAGHPMAASLLSGGRWFFEGSQPAVQLSASDFTVKMTLGAEPLKVANAAASQTLGRPAKLKISGGGEVNGAPNGKPARKTGASTSRVAEDPIVQKMQEVFGAEIRTVIDYQNKK